MNATIKAFLQTLGKPHLVEFDYSDMTGMHHGRCYVHCLFASDHKIKQTLRSFGYRNIRIA